MRVCVRRGSDQIGGSCVQVEHAGYSLVIDAGLTLDADHIGEPPALPMPALATGDPSVLGLLVSHGHPAHYGLVPSVHPSIPVYIGKATQRILVEAAFFSPAGAELRAAGHLRDRRPLTLGPFTATPYLVDCSAFDAYALLVEAGGKRIFYSGDLRAHGRKAALFERLVREPTTGVDVLLLEGASLRRTSVSGCSLEDEVEERCTSLFRETRGLALVAYSGQDVDRLVTMHRAALRAGRTFVLDLYTPSIAAASDRASIPQSTWESVRVFVPQAQRVRVKRAGEFQRLAAIRQHWLFPEQLAERAGGLVMTFRGSMAAELERAGCLAGASAVWSMWPGYLRSPSGEEVTTWLEERGIAPQVLRASGHASVSDLQRLATAISARAVVPMHTAHATDYHGFVKSASVREDGQWWTI